MTEHGQIATPAAGGDLRTTGVHPRRRSLDDPEESPSIGTVAPLERDLHPLPRQRTGDEDDATVSPSSERAASGNESFRHHDVVVPHEEVISHTRSVGR